MSGGSDLGVWLFTVAWDSKQRADLAERAQALWAQMQAAGPLSEGGQALAMHADLDVVAAWLEPHVVKWGLPTLEARRNLRVMSRMADLRAFHAAAVPFLERAITELNAHPVDAIPAPLRALGYMCFALAEVDSAISKWSATILDQARDPRTIISKTNYSDNGSFDAARAFAAKCDEEDPGEGALVGTVVG